MGELISRADLASVAERLRRVLVTVPADPDHAAYLRGAVDTLAMLAACADDSEGVSRNQGSRMRAARRDR
jgi:hypothetical protein